MIDYEAIPPCVFELFDEIMFDTARLRGRATVCSDRASALVFAWGNDPPLLEPRSETRLTRAGLAAYAWYESQLKEKAKEPAGGRAEAPLLEQALAELTPNQGRILVYLWERGTAGYDALSSVPKAWQGGPSDEAITAALKKMRTRLDKANLSVIELVVSAAGRRVTLNRPKE